MHYGHYSHGAAEENHKVIRFVGLVQDPGHAVVDAVPPENYHTPKHDQQLQGLGEMNRMNESECRIKCKVNELSVC